MTAAPLLPAESPAKLLQTRDLREVQTLAAGIFGPTRIIERSRPGIGCAMFHTLRIGSISLAQVDFGSAVDIVADAPKAIYVTQTILQGTVSTGVRRAMTHGRGDTVLYSPGDAFNLSLSGNCRRFCVVVGSEGLQPSLSPTAFLRSPPPWFGATSEAGMRWQALVDYLAVEMQFRMRGGGRWPQSDQALERLVLATMAECWQASKAGSHTRTNGYPAYFHKALAFIEDHLQLPLTMGELETHCGVSSRMLQMSFRKFMGVSPMAYLKERRLKRVRAALQSLPPSRSAVTRVAMDHGFSHMGDFAGDYRRAFGESPSATLQRQQPPEAF